MTRATEYNMALPVPGGQPDTGVQVFSSPDDSLGVTGDRVKVTAGRMFGPAAAARPSSTPRSPAGSTCGRASVLHLIGIPKDAAAAPT